MALLGTLTIANAAAVSSTFRNTRNKQIKLTLQFPSEWTAADLKIQASLDNGDTFIDLKDGAGDIIKMEGIATAAASFYFPPVDGDGKDLFAEFMNNLPRTAIFRFVSIDTADETNENQGAERTIYIYANSTRLAL